MVLHPLAIPLLGSQGLSLTSLSYTQPKCHKQSSQKPFYSLVTAQGSLPSHSSHLPAGHSGVPSWQPGHSWEDAEASVNSVQAAAISDVRDAVTTALYTVVADKLRPLYYQKKVAS